jgi:hypothetical protein
VGRAERITEAIKSHDGLLYCDENKEGKLCVYRKSTRFETYRLDDDSILRFARPTPHFIFALTHDWKAAGNPADWGIEPILARLKAIDLWNRDLAEEIIQQEERNIEASARDRKNNTESFLLEFRKQFAKTFDGVNTANMTKKDSRRLGDKTVKGY